MAQINLLKQKPTNSGASVMPIVAKVLVVVIIGMVGYYFWMYLQVGKVNKQAADLQMQISAQRDSSVSSKSREELLIRQQQLKILDGLVTKHVYWSHIFPELAKVTLKTATYSSIQINATGVISLSVQVPSIIELDKFLQVFDQPQFNANFSNLTIGGFHNAQQGADTKLQFDMQMQYNPQLLKYIEPTAS